MGDMQMDESKMDSLPDVESPTDATVPGTGATLNQTSTEPVIDLPD